VYLKNFFAHKKLSPSNGGDFLLRINKRHVLKAVMDDGRRDSNAGSVRSGTHDYGLRKRCGYERQPPRAQRRFSLLLSFIVERK